MKEKKIVTGEIIKNEALADGIFRMEIQASEVALSAKAGQFVNVYTNNASMLLPRPISVCRAELETLTLVYGVVGKGTEELSSYREGQALRLSSAMGNGYDLSRVSRGQTVLAVGGGIGVPPMLQLALAARKLGAKVIAVTGFKDQPFLISELELAGAEAYVATDSGAEGFQGTVLELIREKGLQADHWFACGPKVMLRALSEYVLQQGQDVQVSMEERMGCGYGACVGCVCDIRELETGAAVRKKVCKDGPVFWGSEVVWDGK